MNTVLGSQYTHAIIHSIARRPACRKRRDLVPLARGHHTHPARLLAVVAAVRGGELAVHLPEPTVRGGSSPHRAVCIVRTAQQKGGQFSHLCGRRARQLPGIAGSILSILSRSTYASQIAPPPVRPLTRALCSRLASRGRRMRLRPRRPQRPRQLPRGSSPT